MDTQVKVTTPNERQIAMTRVFDAPRNLVFDAWTKPELMKRWFTGNVAWELVECEIDLRVGGSYRWVWKGPNGERMGITGVYQEIVPNERVVATEKFDEEWYPGGAVVRMDLTERDGKTTFTTTVTYNSQETRDMVMKTPMAQGFGVSCGRLAEFLKALDSVAGC